MLKEMCKDSTASEGIWIESAEDEHWWGVWVCAALEVEIEGAEKVAWDIHRVVLSV